MKESFPWGNGQRNATIITLICILLATVATSVDGFSSRPIGSQTRRAATQRFGITTPQDTTGNPWFTWKSKQAEENPQQSDAEAVDEYLEFLDRRYRRLHDEQKAELAQPAFSAWNWLKQEPLESSEQQTQNTEDALYVLGVAGLASKKLLQKHQPRRAIDAIDVVPTKEPHHLVQRLAKLVYLRYYLQVWQSRLLQSARLAVARAPRRILSRLFQFGGGQRNVVVTVSLTAAVAFFVARTILHAMASQGVHVA